MDYYNFNSDNMASIAKAQDDAIVGTYDPNRSKIVTNFEKGVKNEGVRFPKNETLAQHLEHCKAEDPRDCPFRKAYQDIDEMDLEDIKVTKTQAFDRLAVALTQLFALGTEIATTAIDDDANYAKTVSQAIEKGIDVMKEVCEQFGATVKMDEAGSKYIIIPPQSKN